ncbi:MAG: prolyl oligopeptidase family serine peptidase [Roseivirga sp.]|nr:prolyl oligopeptidase family serine peptidase [Roseivirga sp.]
MSFLMPANLNFRGLFSGCLFAILSTGLLAQSSTPGTLKVEDYGKWESLGFSRGFSPDGNWFVYDIRRNNDKNEYRLHNLRAGTIKVLTEGQRASFSSDSRWLGYFIAPSAAERKKSKKPLRNKFRLMDLNGGDSLTIKDVSSFSFSDKADFLAMKRYPAKGKKSRGGDLVIRNLATGVEVNFGNVAQFSWQEEGSLLAMVIDADGKAGNGIQLFNSTTGTIRVLDNKEAVYTGLNWRDDSDDLSVFRSFKDEGYEDSTQHILAWKGLAGKKVETFVFDQTAMTGFSDDHRVVNNRSLTWSDKGESIFFNITAWNKIPEPDTTKTDKSEAQDLTDEAPDLQIWHSKDVQVIPEQERKARGKREDQYTAVWHLADNSYVQLTNDLVERVNLQTDLNKLIGYDASPYEQDAMFGRGNNDIYIIDLKTGNQTKVLSKLNFAYNLSPNGRYLPYIKGGELFVRDLNTNADKQLSNENASFVNRDDDHPSPEKFPYRFISWEQSGKSFFIHSKYDVWQFWADGSRSRKITDGKATGTLHRIVYVDFENRGKPIDEKAAMYVSLFGEKSKKSGYGSVVPGKPLKTHVWQDARVGRLTKAKEADQYAFVSETFSDSPDYFTVSGDFSDVKQVSETNPFQKDYLWGKSELVTYKNHNGKELQGVLYYPANYEAGKKYPMITYIYELLSNGLHGYGMPSQRNYYSNGVFTQEGYFVLRPDILFDAGDPGISSVRTMEAAVKKVVDMGLVDEKKVGLIGHSWGGYQAGYAVTQTDIFAASVAGAGLTNLTSMYGMIAWAFGGAPESAHFEVSQERMEVPPYEDVERYIRNSSVFNVHKLNTPLLFEVGDNDQNVDWRQGIEYYNAARRAGKQFVLLVYAKEGHGLRQDKNRSDYQMRILKWFGHYLKGDEAPAWINQGVSYEEQMKTLKDWKK